MPVITPDLEEKLLGLLVNEGLIDANRLTILRTEAASESLLERLQKEESLDEQTLAHATAALFGVPFVFLPNVIIDQNILQVIPLELVKKMRAVAIGKKDDRLVVAMADATDIQSVDYLSSMVDQPIRAVMTNPADIKPIIEQYNDNLEVVNASTEQALAVNDAGIDGKTVQTIVQDSPVAKALVSLLEYSIRARASDIHIEPYENVLLVRCRIDGILREVMKLPKAIEMPLVARIKILASLKIDDRRAPQDGQFTVNVMNKNVDLRIATAPIVWGEQVVIRILEKTDNVVDIETMGIRGRAYRALRKGISQPNGMVLTSGPTGSGKSTTLYALIKAIKSEEINIVTLEDPVEYKMEGVNQIQVNTEAGLTFASGLRSILRQDPDVVMVGEIRDAETAQLAVQAALTGHLVFSTLHTNSAAGIMPRLLDMGVEPFLLASTLNTVIGQRLLRRIGKRQESYDSNEIETKMIKDNIGWLLPDTKEAVAKYAEDVGYEGLPLRGSPNFKLTRGIPSDDEPGGYRGRVGIYEALEVDYDIQKMISARAGANDIEKIALAKGMVTMRQDGLLKSLAGQTTVSEVSRVTNES
ncbi:Flp pilus assembly complex ATPase component TadA [Candidatus Saccharibacteria bacterium]|nr:Flp pilus assembly complex ATPase component TadA [Candidatus Saccharibacteria bacterium]